MPKINKKMSKSLQSMHGTIRRSSALCGLLDADEGVFDSQTTVKPHLHPFWQIEMGITGSQKMFVQGNEFLLKAGEIILLPPGTEHEIFYLEDPTRFFSFKFHLYGMAELPQSGKFVLSKECRILRRALTEIMRSYNKFDPVALSITEHLLSALVDLYLESQKRSASEATLAMNMKSYILAAQGRPVRLAKLARMFGYSVAHASNRFRKEMGMPVKRFIDEQRAEAARRFLSYSDLSVNEAASRLQFPDPYTFSHFCRRMFGQSPREFRKNSHSAAGQA